jgi:hypothetical protein
VDLLEQVIRTTTSGTQSDLTISRISVSTYSSIPTKTSQGRPVQVLVNRTITPSVTVWPVPDQSEKYTLIYWRMRRIQDAGNGVNTMDVPFRLIPCMVAGLAYYVALKIPGGVDRLQILKQQYDEAWQLAADEDREKASVRFVPRGMHI